MKPCAMTPVLARRSWLAAGLTLGAAAARGQAGAIDLGIPNIPQRTPVWCWVAVVEQIIRWRQGGAGPSQAELVAMANGMHPQACFQPANPMVYQACMRTGHLAEIQGLLAAFGGGFSALAPPTHPQPIYATLRQGRPIILALQSTPFSGHVVVLRGMLPAPDPLLLINDPMAWNGLGQAVPFSAILGFWQAAIVLV